MDLSMVKIEAQFGLEDRLVSKAKSKDDEESAFFTRGYGQLLRYFL